MSEAVELSQEALETIGSYVRKNLRAWMEEVRPQAGSARDRGLTGRRVRVEEELKAQRDLMRQGFEHVDKRFEQVDKRFEQVDKRLEQVDKRFEQVDKRFEEMDKRFVQMNLRFGDMSSHMSRWFTVMTIMLGVIGIAVTVTSFMP